MAATENLLGAFLKDRRARLDPARLGFAPVRRRTPGLRREEVAQRAAVSATWYTWLEQGRGGAPSADVLDRIAGALLLTEAEREHIYLLAQRRPPEASPRETGPVTPQLQRMIDALELSPALVKSPAWDILAWNRAAAAVLTDYATLPPAKRNLLRLLFSSDKRLRMRDWDGSARFAVANFRLETARSGTTEAARALVEELSRSSPEFAALWRANDVDRYGEGVKHLDHPVAGPLTLEYSTFAVDGRPDLGLMVFTPATDADRARVRHLIEGPAERRAPAAAC